MSVGRAVNGPSDDAAVYAADPVMAPPHGDAVNCVLHRSQRLRT